MNYLLSILMYVHIIYKKSIWKETISKFELLVIFVVLEQIFGLCFTVTFGFYSTFRALVPVICSQTLWILDPCWQSTFWLKYKLFPITKVTFGLCWTCQSVGYFGPNSVEKFTFSVVQTKLLIKKFQKIISPRENSVYSKYLFFWNCTFQYYLI